MSLTLYGGHRGGRRGIGRTLTLKPAFDLFREGNYSSASSAVHRANAIAKGNTMAAIPTQIWKSARLTIARGESETHGTVFRLSETRAKRGDGRDDTSTST